MKKDLHTYLNYNKTWKLAKKKIWKAATEESNKTFKTMYFEIFFGPFLHYRPNFYLDILSSSSNSFFDYMVL